MAEKSLDRRARMTRKILKQSLIELMKEKPIHEISIKKICETADINRSTFYHHYGSQYELFDDIFNDVSSDVYTLVQKHFGKENYIELILEDTFVYLEKHRATTIILLSENGGLSIGEKVSVLLDDFFNFNITTGTSSYCAQFISAGTISIVWKWINDENRIPAHELAKTISTLIYTGVRDSLILSVK